MKVHLLTLFVLLATCSSRPAFAQESSGWLPYFENDVVTIALKHAERSDTVNGIYASYILIRLVNKTDEAVSVSFRKELTYGASPARQADPVAVALPPHAMAEGSVEAGTNPSLRIFVAHKKNGSDQVLKDYSLSAIVTAIIED